MVFLGTTFCSGRYSLHPSPTSIAEITAIQIFDGTYNQLFLSADSSLNVNNFDDEWTYDTQFNATFDKDFEAGNSGFSLKTTDHIVIKRRELLGQTKWITIYVKEINTVEDFNINIKDTYARAGVEYEYCISFFINGVENNYVIKNVYSDFDGFYITDKDCLYGTIYDVDGCDTSRDTVSKAQKILNSKYMSVVSNSDSNCDNASISGSFLKFNNCNELDKSATLQYRKDVINRLSNHKPLILKIHDGRIWMIKVVGNITDNQKGHVDLRQISFEWVEVGDINDMETLYRAGFSDVDSRWW